MWLRLFLLAGCGVAATVTSGEDRLNFNRDIRPLLSDRCFACHGPDAAERHADLRLDYEQAAKEYAIEPGSPQESLIIQRIRSTDPDTVMPPPETGKPLSAEEVARIERWVSEGSPYATHWAYVAPKRHSPPTISGETKGSHWIDSFIHASLSESRISSLGPADSISQVRRLAYDLTGLPPSEDMVQAFQMNPSEHQYRRIVDQLLSSPRFGERMASIWFDLVRYADTVGYHGDQDHNIAPYRDWVIDAFNANMPFDQFTREQLAGDLIENPTIDQKIASGYNRLLQTTHEGGLQPKEYLAIYAADRVRNVSAVWMGATLGCAQCHDHKYDPFTAKDFYSMAAFFADIDEARHFREGKNSLPTNRPPEIDVLRPVEREALLILDQQIAALEKQQLRLNESTEPTDSQTSETTRQLEANNAGLNELIDRRDRLHALTRRTMVTVSIEPREIRILPRGDWLDDSGPIVQPAVPEFLQMNIARDGGADRLDRANRLDLANWLTDIESGYGRFTSRVMVNRFWSMLFGHGLSRSMEDFGGQGEPPSHPELLDNLAVEFYESGWGIKHIIREIVLSETYRRSSANAESLPSIDVANRLLARQNRFRLPAEMIRDQALLLGDLLVLQAGGASSKPYQPTDYYRHLNFPVRTYKHDRDANQYRRGVYVHWQRQFLHPMLRAFDAPSREECTAQRSASNTPLASLTIMNDPTFVEAARGFALQILKPAEKQDSQITLDSYSLDSNSDSERITRAFQSAVARQPDSFEVQVLEQTLQIAREQFSSHPRFAEQYLEVGMFRSSLELDPVEFAAWTEVARTILNLNELMVRP